MKDEKKGKARRGRPSVYTPETARAICERIADGETLRSICKDAAMPAASTVRGWALDDVDGFFALSTRAYTLGFEEQAEQCFEIADDTSNDWTPSSDPTNPAARFNSEHVQRARLRIDTRMRLLGKWAPKKYGDKLAVGGADDLPPIKVMNADEAAIRVAFLLNKAVASKDKTDCSVPAAMPPVGAPAAIMSPPVAFALQANIAHGPQQVNNGVPHGTVGVCGRG